MKKTLLMVVALVVIVAAFAGCGAAANSVEGKWYDKAGQLGTIEFKAGGAATMTTMGLAIDGTYTFDAAKGEGKLTISLLGQEQSSDFKVANGELNIDGQVYTKTVVEQQDLSQVLEGLTGN